jgi:type II secretory pathway predicted ATPase ExeA
MDYLTFYRLDDDPFRLTPDPKFFYPTPEHNDALFSLEYVVKQQEGFSLILGGPGTGKTTVLRVFMAKWGSTADIALVMTPRLTPEEFLQAVLEDLDVHIRTGNKNEMIKAFRDVLVERSLSGRRVIIIVDEAQNLPDETLEELRLLSNLETEKEKLLQIILVGQPELARKLASEGLEQLSQRIGVKAALNPLGLDETREYINYRLIKAGKGSAIFRDDAIRSIHRLSKGVPRLINLFASRSLMAASVEGAHEIVRAHVHYAKQHLAAGNIRPDSVIGTWTRRLRSAVVPYALAGVILVVAISIVFAKVNTGEKAAVRLHADQNTQPAVITATLSPGGATGSAHLRSTRPLVKAASTIGKTVVFSTAGNLRERPSVDAPVITWAREGAVFEVCDETSDESSKNTWFRVRLRDGGEAWVSSGVAKRASPES